MKLRRICKVCGVLKEWEADAVDGNEFSGSLYCDRCWKRDQSNSPVWDFIDGKLKPHEALSLKIGAINHADKDHTWPIITRCAGYIALPPKLRNAVLDECVRLGIYETSMVEQAKEVFQQIDAEYKRSPKKMWLW